MTAPFSAPSAIEHAERSAEATPSGVGISPENGTDSGVAPPLRSSAGGAPKRSRVLLSCAPCRFSKLKCDRQTPCSQCLKKGRVEGCLYAPRPDKSKPTKSMSARLKRLEGMVRGMMDSETPSMAGGETDSFAHRQGGQVVMGKDSATYVGATHFMAMLDDIEDLKGYFDDDDEVPQDSPSPEASPPEIFVLRSGAYGPTSKEELLSVVPAKPVVDRLIHRYFNANSPSQHIIHRPTFLKQYGEFCKDPSDSPLEWIALLLLVIALATFFSTFMAPHELEGDSAVPPMERFRQYRGAAAWALVQAKYTNPKFMTLAPLLLYVEAEFLINRSSQMQCYVMTGVCLRIMMKMGLHRDPSKMPNIRPFEGEMRRRMWNLAVQIDLIVSFHTGLPSMIHGIESDTGLPRNLFDDDLDENCTDLPPARPDTVYTALTYPIWKSTMCRLFGLVARQAHSLSVPNYVDVMKLDTLIEDKWKHLPIFMKIKPLSESIADPPSQINQRFGLASLYQKSRCVLHRRYLLEAMPKKEHAYSRRVCLEAALGLLTYQETIHVATQPGGILRQNGWFVSSLAVHDFLLAATVVYLVLQNEACSEVNHNHNWMEQGTPLPNKQELYDLLKKSSRIWDVVAKDYPGAKKACNAVNTMLKRLPGSSEFSQDSEELQETDQNGGAAWFGMNPLFNSKSVKLVPISGLSLDGSQPSSAPGVSELAQQAQTGLARTDLVPDLGPIEPPWLDLGTAHSMMDWDTFDQAVYTNHSSNQPPDPLDEWLGQQKTPLMGELGYVPDVFWTQDKP